MKRLYSAFLLCLASHVAVTQDTGFKTFNQGRNAIISNAEQPRMQFVGIIGSKSFFLTTDEDSNWMASEGKCGSADLTFAILENAAEFNFVQSQLPTTWFWVGAALKGLQENNRDNWEWIDGSSIAQGINFLYSPAQIWQCLAFYSHVLYPRVCLVDLLPALCQSKTV